MTPTSLQLAREFCRVLNEWLSPEELAEVNRLNSEEDDRNICHTGDYCDSNQALLDAMEVFGIDGFDQSLIPLCNATWSIARRAGFSAEKIPITIQRGSVWKDSAGIRVAVSEVSSDSVQFHREGGGWVGVMPVMTWLERFTPPRPLPPKTGGRGNQKRPGCRRWPFAARQRLGSSVLSHRA